MPFPGGELATMKKLSETGLRFVPALRGIFGSWVYYSAIMTLRDVAAQVHIAEEIHPSKRLSKMIQRELKKKRAKEIAEYLVQQDDRFFNSLVVAVYRGEPKWFALKTVDSRVPGFDGSQIEDSQLATVGFLALSGGEKFFALDGQHRLAGIRRALSNCPDRGDDEISVLFVAHRETRSGRQRTRRLFTTLNKRAKPVAKGAIIALDEDDAMAIVCRRLVEEHPWFVGKRIAYQATNNMPSSNRQAFTTIGALYDALTVLFCQIHGAKKERMRYYRPSDKELELWHRRTLEFFSLLHDRFEPFTSFCDAGNKFAAVTRVQRNAAGGSVLFRPIGLLILAEAIDRLRKEHRQASLSELVVHLSRMQWCLTEPPFADIIWDVRGKRMVAGTKALCRDLVLFVGGEDTGANTLMQKYAKFKGVSVAEAREQVGRLERLPHLKA